MPKYSRDLWKTAQSIHHQIAGRIASAEFDLPDVQWRDLESTARQITVARRRGWNRCAAQLTKDLAVAADRLVNSAQRLARDAWDADRTTAPASAADIYRDLIYLEAELEEMIVDPESSELRVTTEPIELAGVHLGPFQICLDIARLRETLSYRVVALDPNPARSNDEVTHPHVSHETLCEGDGQTAIRAALESGRVGDFFELVAQVLRTYAVGSAYVELEDWDGFPCSGCGETVGQSDRSYCGRCDATCCSECLGYCEHCDESRCHECLGSCAACLESVCTRCIDSCSTCRIDCCPNCLTDGKCERCQKLSEENDDEKNRSPDAPVQSDRLGEAAVSA